MTTAEDTLTRDELLSYLDEVIESDEVLKAADELLGTSLMGLAKGLSQITDLDEDVIGMELAQFVGELIDRSLD